MRMVFEAIGEKGCILLGPVIAWYITGMHQDAMVQLAKIGCTYFGFENAVDIGVVWVMSKLHMDMLQVQTKAKLKIMILGGMIVGLTASLFYTAELALVDTGT